MDDYKEVSQEKEEKDDEEKPSLLANLFCSRFIIASPFDRDRNQD